MEAHVPKVVATSEPSALHVSWVVMLALVRHSLLMGSCAQWVELKQRPTPRVKFFWP